MVWGGKLGLRILHASDSPIGAPAGETVVLATVVAPDDAVVAASSSPSKMGTIKLSLVMSLYLVTKTVNLRHKCVSASKVSKICRWWK